MGPQTLHYGDAAIPYTVEQRPGVNGKITIHVHPDGKVEVDAPEGSSPEKIRAAVRKRAHWINGHIEKIRERQRDLLPRKYVSGESHFYLGRRYMLKVLEGVRQDQGVKLIAGQLRVTVTDKNSIVVRDLLAKWYRDHARMRFENQIAQLSQDLPWVRKKTPPVKLLMMKKHWGSCSPTGSIVLNPQLVKAPSECINYVILHELCHLKEHNHSSKFWQLMDRVLPDWQKRKKRLDDMAGTLLNT